jgi:hypothetical protein
MGHDYSGSGAHCDQPAGYAWGGNWLWIIVVIIVIVILFFFFWSFWGSASNVAPCHGSFAASLDCEQVVPQSQSLATGNGTFVLSGQTGKQVLNYEIVVSDFSFEPRPSYFCHGKAGQKGSHVKNLGKPEVHGGKCHFKGVWRYDDREPLTKEHVDQLMRGEIYVTIASAQYPDGEVRGQVHRR